MTAYNIMKVLSRMQYAPVNIMPHYDCTGKGGAIQGITGAMTS